MSGLAEKVAAVPYWYHRIALPGGVQTPGWAPVSPAAYRIPQSLAGKRVLDVGSWDGYWTFEALRRGAAEVVAIENFSDPLLGSEQPRSWQSFDLCREALGYGEDRCKRMELSVYDAAKLGRFDVVFLFGILYHLRHPLLALDVLSPLCADSLFIESAICDDYSPYRGGIGHGYRAEMVMEFYPGAEYGRSPTNWWVPTLRTLEAMVRSCGWPHVSSWHLAAAPTAVCLCRGFVKASRSAQ